MTDQEKVYHEDNNIKITNTRAVFYITTYALANITSVRIFKKPPSRGAALLLGFGGVVIGLVGLIVVDLVSSFGYLIILLGIATIGLGIYLGIRAKPDYIVRVSSASGEVDELKSKDKGYIQRIDDAVNQAIIERG